MSQHEEQEPMFTLHELAQTTMLERSATKIMQLNMKCGNQKYGET